MTTGYEFDRELTEQAIWNVRQRVVPQTRRAFELMTIECRSGAETAKELGMQVATVFVAKSKVLKMLQEERKSLEAE
ncbi:MAG: hypothetical protein ABL921_09155 [Pirellula sp.]